MESYSSNGTFVLKVVFIKNVIRFATARAQAGQSGSKQPFVIAFPVHGSINLVNSLHCIFHRY